jgi:hypothetical protein
MGTQPVSVIGFYDGTVKVWDVEEGVEVQSFGESSDGEWSSWSRGTDSYLA